MLIRELDLNDIGLFVKVAELGSFTRAGAFFGLPVSSVSRRIGRLEDKLGGRLLERSTRSLRLTPIGKVFFRYAQQGLEEIQFGAHALGGSDEPRGRLRISTPVLLGQLMLDELILEFMARCPQVQCVLELSNRRVDLVHEDFDIAIRVGPLPDTSMIAKKLGRIPMALLAAPAYLADAPPLKRPEDLANHRILDLNPGREETVWPLRKGDELVKCSLRPQLATSDLKSIVGAVRRGFGVGKAPALQGTREGDRSGLVRVLPDWELPAPDVFALYPHFRSATPALRAFLDFVGQHLREAELFLAPADGD